MGARLAAAGYVAMTFDYKGWGKSEGPPLRLAPYGRVEDTQAALTFLAERPEADWARQVVGGQSEMADRGEVLQHDPQSAEIAAAARRNLAGAAMQVPLEFVHETLSFRPEWVVGRNAPRAAFFITSDG